jgi:hypothetical protein
MTAQTLLGILKLIESYDSKFGLQKNLEAIKEALSSLASSPAQPQFQSSLAAALTAFSTGCGSLRASLTPSQAASIGDIGGAEFFDPAMAEKVATSVEKNAMTPTVARDFVQDFATRRATFLSTVRGAHQSLENLGIKISELKPGSADVAFLIPRNIFNNDVGSFAKELDFISRLVRHFTEAQTGQVGPVELEQLSSTVPTVTLLANASVLSLMGMVVNKFLDAWEKIERIRKIRAELSEMGMKRTTYDELTEQITTTISEVVEESTEVVIGKYPGAPERKNELANAIRQDTQRLFGQIERGLTVEFRAEPKAAGGDEEDQKALQEIANMAKQLKFPPVATEPLLLGTGEIIEGEIAILKQTKKTTTQKTSTSKKGGSKEDGGE